MIHLFTVVTPYMLGKMCRELRDNAVAVMAAGSHEYKFQRKHYMKLVTVREGLGYTNPCVREKMAESCLRLIYDTYDHAETMSIFWMRTQLAIIPPNWKKWGLYLPRLDITRHTYAEHRFNAGTLTKSHNPRIYKVGLN